VSPASLRDLWPPWRDEWVLYEDADLIVVDKPAGIPTHPPTPDRSDDAHSRLAEWLRARGATDSYLGIHQRLDADTSGVLLFTRRKASNPSIAEQFERRRVAKSYLAVVSGWRGSRASGVLEHRLAPDEGGSMRVVGGRSRAGQQAITRFRVVRSAAARTLLELSPETGRTHQIRVQLAAEGAPVIGDARYGGEPASRLLLHASSLSIIHPTTQKPLTFSSPAPAELDAALGSGEGERSALRTTETIAERLRAAADRRYATARLAETDAFRLANGGGDELPGVAVDIYGAYLVVSLSSDAAEEARERVLDAAASLGASGVYLKVRPKDASTIIETRGERVAPRNAVRGSDAPEPMIVRELGLAFEVRLGDGLSTGIFLDQRQNRRRVRDMAKGLRVANLFAYTAAFTVAAAAGGARASVSVDVSKGALAWARRNLDAVGADPSAHELVETDVLRWLAAASRSRARFDLVIFDPPSFATTKTSRFAAASDYRRVAASCLGILAPGGRLLACTNHRGIVMAKLRRYLHEAAREAGRTIVQMKDLPPPVDFPPDPGSEPHLKSVLVTVDR
jgi:23S rRNA (cytosine1962-C5)-methyltransferase